MWFLKPIFLNKLNGQTRFCQDGPNVVYFLIVNQDFLQQDQQLKNTQNWDHLGKIWFCHSISFEILLYEPLLECQSRQRFETGDFSTG